MAHILLLALGRLLLRAVFLRLAQPLGWALFSEWRVFLLMAAKQDYG
jgi:hypothetical protein